MTYRFGSAALTAAGALLLTGWASTPPAFAQTGHAVLTVKLQMDPTALNEAGMKTYHTGYFPVPVKLSLTRPTRIVKEPAYTGKPLYGTIQLGNGPKSSFVVALDPSDKGDYKVYVDSKQNGDLADNTDGAWTKKMARGTSTVYGINSYVLRASWGANGRETSSSDYGIGLYCFAAPGAAPRLFMMRQAARVGTITVADKVHKALLVENDADALFSKPVDVDAQGQPVSAPKTRPVWLLVDLNDDGKMQPIDARAPFKLDGKTYDPTISVDGSRMTLTPTTKVAADLAPKQEKQPPLLAAGTVAPAFTAQAPDGTTVQLADYKGKVVILDFWATWCGPCQKSMPHLEKVYDAVAGKDVAVLALCVFDEKSAFDSWLPEHKSAYKFPLAFDPAGRDPMKSIAGKLYQVSGIPTTYIIGKDGKIVDTVVGYEDGDTRVEAALKKAGIEIPAQHASAK